VIKFPTVILPRTWLDEWSEVCLHTICDIWSICTMIRFEDASIGTVWVTCLLAVGLYFIRSRLLGDQFDGFPSVNSRKPWEVLNVFAHKRFQKNGPEYLRAGFAKVCPIQTSTSWRKRKLNGITVAHLWRGHRPGAQTCGVRGLHRRFQG
jgi:hypothetical protein